MSNPTPALSSCTTPAENGQGSLCQAAGTSAAIFPFFWLYGETGNGCAPQCTSPWKLRDSNTFSHCAEQGVECLLIIGEAAQSFIKTKRESNEKTNSLLSPLNRLTAEGCCVQYGCHAQRNAAINTCFFLSGRTQISFPIFSFAQPGQDQLKKIHFM